METHGGIEILTLEEFAARMKVGETTVWKWIKHGRLKPGRHYIQIDRVIRFNWCSELIERLHEDCVAPEEMELASEPEEQPKERRRTRYAKCPINLNY